MLLVEADGARHRSLKAPAAHEPRRVGEEREGILLAAQARARQLEIEVEEDDE